MIKPPSDGSFVAIWLKYGRQFYYDRDMGQNRLGPRPTVDIPLDGAPRALIVRGGGKTSCALSATLQAVHTYLVARSYLRTIKNTGVDQ